LSPPSLAYSRLKLAEVLAERGRLAEAKNHYEILCAQVPGHAMAHLGLARAAFAEGKFEESTRWLAPCLTNQATAKAAYTLLAAAQYRLGNSQAGATARGLADSLEPDRSWPNPFDLQARELATGRMALIEECQALLYQNQLQQAWPVIQKLTATYPDAPEGWLYVGRIRLLEGRYAEAAEAFTRHLELKPESVDGHIQMGLLLLRQEQYELAMARFQEAIALKPDSEGAHYNLGLAQLRLGRLKEAQAAFLQALHCKPSFVEAYLSLALVLKRSNQTEEAIAQLRQAMLVNPFDLRVQQLLEELQRGG